MSHLSKQFNVQHGQGRVCDGLAKHHLGIRTEGCLQLFFGAVGVYEGHVDTHALHGHTDQVESAAIDSGAGNDVVAAGADIKQRIEVSSLAGSGEHGGCTALQGRDLRRNHVTGRILQTGVEVAGGLQVKELTHILRGSILKGCALNNRDLTGLTAGRTVARLDAQGFCM